MAVKEPEYFPSVEELLDIQRHNASETVDHIQTLGRMAQEFCGKMQALGFPPQTCIPDDDTAVGYVIPAHASDCGNEPDGASLFVGVNGLLGVFGDDGIQLPTPEEFRSDQLVPMYSQSLLDALRRATFCPRD